MSLEDRQRQMAEKFRQSQKSHKKILKDVEHSKEARKAYLAIAPAFDVEDGQVRAAWKESDGDVDVFTHLLQGSGLEDVVVCHNKVNNDITALMSIQSSPVWKVFIKALSQGIEEPVVVFTLKHRGFHVLTNKARNRAALLIPRVMVPVGGAAPVQILPMDVFIEENA